MTSWEDIESDNTECRACGGAGTVQSTNEDKPDTCSTCRGSGLR